MNKHYKAKTFKSGNSVALRLPAAMGIKPGREMRIEGDARRFDVVEVEAPRPKIDVDSFWGKASGLRHLTPEEKEFEERPSARAREGNSVV